MDGFCLMIMQTIQQTIRDAADREIENKVTHVAEKREGA
jgi:hypothetical protein